MDIYDQSDNVKIKLSPSPSDDSSEDDPNRRELPWSSRQENLLVKWQKEMDINARAHERAGVKYKRIYGIVALPPTLVPIILSALTTQLESYPLVSSMLMLTSGILSGYSAFFNLGKKYNEHFNYQTKYEQLSRSISKCLSKNKPFRPPADVFLEMIFSDFNSINNSAPYVNVD